MGQLVAAVCDEFKKMAGAISDEELQRAKNQLKSSLLMNLESRPILFEDIGRQVCLKQQCTCPVTSSRALTRRIPADFDLLNRW